VKALAVILFALLVAAHPLTAAAVLAAEFGVCAVIGRLIWRAVPLSLYRPRRAL
jgi:hypothetical protein